MGLKICKDEEKGFFRVNEGILQWNSCHFNERPISRGFDYFFVSH